MHDLEQAARDDRVGLRRDGTVALVPPAAGCRCRRHDANHRRGGVGGRGRRPGTGRRSHAATLAETTWCVYAWPVEAGVTGCRVFVIDQSGDVLSTRNADGRYSGTGKPPPADAVRKAASRGRMQDGAAFNAVGRDRQEWSVIG